MFRVQHYFQHTYNHSVALLFYFLTTTTTLVNYLTTTFPFTGHSTIVDLSLIPFTIFRTLVCLTNFTPYLRNIFIIRQRFIVTGKREKYEPEAKVCPRYSRH